jgi:hypothetical protein
MSPKVREQCAQEEEVQGHEEVIGDLFDVFGGHFVEIDE